MTRDHASSSRRCGHAGGVGPGRRPDPRQGDAAAAVPPARFTERPAPGEWSANEVMAHVVAAGRYFGGAIEAIVSAIHRSWAWVNATPFGGPVVPAV